MTRKLPTNQQLSQVKERIVEAVHVFNAKYLSHKAPTILTADNYDSYSTVKTKIINVHWKFQNFCVIQILREINFGESRSCKTAFLAIFRALNFIDLVNSSLPRMQKIMKMKIQRL